MTSGTLNIEARDSNKGVLHADAGNLNFSTGTLTIENGSYIDLDVKVALPENSVIDIKKAVLLLSMITISGMVKLLLTAVFLITEQLTAAL